MQKYLTIQKIVVFLHKIKRMTQSEILKKAVQESGMKIEHLCDKVGVRSQTYRNFIQSGKGLATHHLEKFAEVLGYDINWNKK